VYLDAYKATFAVTQIGVLSMTFQLLSNRCTSRTVAATPRDLRQIGGDARFAESDADHTARVERETQLA